METEPTLSNRMAKDDTPKTLGELRDEATGAKPLQIAGQPAVACPYCGAAMFVNRTDKMASRTERYRICRNESCGRSFKTKQPPEVFVREIVDDETISDDLSAGGNHPLRLLKDTG